MKTDGSGPLAPLRQERPRLFRAAGQAGFEIPPPDDPVRQRILANILSSCEDKKALEPMAGIPVIGDSPHPFHQLYIAFIVGLEATALIEQYSFAWRVTGDERWMRRTRCWLDAATSWEHSDRVEEHFYTANRYMHAFAVALDWVAGALTEAEEERIEACMSGLLQRWWPDVDAGRDSSQGGHHAVVDYGHFGVAALQLLGRHPQAQQWVQAVVDRFRAGIMPNGCGEDGSPVDRLGFEGNENTWMLQFCDALRHVTGIDLYREFPDRVSRPALYMRYHLDPPVGMAPQRYAPAYATSLNNDGATQHGDASAAVLRIAQETGDTVLRQIALRDPMMGRIHHAGFAVRSATDDSALAEAILARGPYAYLWYEPGFIARRGEGALPLCRRFSASYGESIVCRSGWESPSLVAQVVGYSGYRGANAFSGLHVRWAGHPVLTCISAYEAIPVFCGSVPSVGGQNEHVATVREVSGDGDADTVVMESPRTWHEYRLLRGQAPALLVAVSRKPRGVRIIQEGGKTMACTDGQDCLQYPREPYLNPVAGELRMRVRLRSAVDDTRTQVLFHTGTSLLSAGTNVNSLFLGHMGDGKGLTFGVRSQRYLLVTVSIPSDVAAMEPGRWQEITARWGGFNTPGASPFIELELDGRHRRFDDPAAFGEVGRDTIGMERRQRRAFYTRPNTVLAFGAAVQLRGCGTEVDIADIRLDCPGREPLRADFSAGLGAETGSGELVYKLNPTNLLHADPNGALLGAGPERVRAIGGLPETAFRRETVPFYAAPLPGSSLKYYYAEGYESDATRLLASCGNGDRLVFLFASEAADVRCRRTDGGLELTLDGNRHRFGFGSEEGRVLQPR